MVGGEHDPAFDAFYRRHYRLVLTTVEYRVAGMAVAEDVTAEVFRIAWKHHSVGGRLSKSFLYGVARNVIGNEYRRAARARDLLARLGIGLGLVRESQQDDDAQDDAIDLRHALRELRDQDRTILYMTYWDDLSGQEVAEILGVTAPTVRVRLTRARQALGAILLRQGWTTRHGKEASGDGRAGTTDS